MYPPVKLQRRYQASLAQILCTWRCQVPTVKGQSQAQRAWWLQTRACLWLCEPIKENNRLAGLKALVRPHLDLDLDPEPFVCLARWRLC